VVTFHTHIPDAGKWRVMPKPTWIPLKAVPIRHSPSIVRFSDFAHCLYQRGAGADLTSPFNRLFVLQNMQGVSKRA
jgi:hypothetical protein